MSKMNLSRCAAVGIAGLTAMSSIAIVASAATQASLIYELKYVGIEKVLMKTTVAYATGATEYCQRPSTIGVEIDKGFNVDFTNLKALNADYQVASVNATNNSIYYSTGKTGTVWNAADFSGTGISDGMSAAGWVYKAPLPSNPTTAGEVKLGEVYANRSTGTGVAGVIAFKTESERSAAKNSIITTVKNEYSTLANAAVSQFRNDVNKAAENAKKRLLDTKNATEKAVKDTYEATDKSASYTAIYNKDMQNAANLYNASVNAITTSANKIITEFTQTFNANNFNFDYAFFENNAPIQYSSTVGGISVIHDAKYSSFGDTATTDLADSRYWNGSTLRENPASYVFRGEIQPKDVFDGSKAFVFIGSVLNWVNFEVIDNSATTGGNTTSSGGSTTGNNNNNNTTTTTTTWYPDSATYRGASEVSYLGNNGNWYTSSGAAQLYGGGYSGTSKSSNYSDVNTSTNTKAIYFDATTGSYSTTSSSYSYVVKEASSTSNTSNSEDPYYNYFFGGGNVFNNNNSTSSSVPEGSPAISGVSRRYAGWTNISSYISRRSKSGTTLTINMNESSVVPSAVLSAAKSKNVTLTFKNKNGSTVTVKPSTSMAGNDLNTSVVYNVKDIKTSLVTKAKKVNSAVSSAQIRVASDGNLGGTETINVKFGTNRSGYTVKAYRLTESGSLRKEATGTINDSGRVNLNLTKGGSYVLVVCR